MSSQQKTNRKQLVSWALYDWANSAYATTVMSGFFPLFFKQYWSHETPVTTSTFYLGLGNSIASLIIVLAAPVLGAFADQGRIRKRMLAAFMSTGVLVCIGLFFVSQGMWQLAIVLYVIGVIGFSGANVFYDSMLVLVSPTESRHRDSAFGFALGYLGGGLLFLVNVIMTLKPAWFGLADAATAVRWSFISVGVWWAVFTVPLLLYVRDTTDTPGRPKTTSRLNHFASISHNAFDSLRTTLANVSRYRNVWLFLLAYWFYIDGVATIIKMGVDYGLSIGLPANSLITALLLVQFIGFPATLFFGRLSHRLGVKFTLWIALWVYVLATCYSYFMNSSMEFYVLAAALGLVQGAVQSQSRSLFSQLIPPGKTGEFFGFMNMIGKSAAVIGPVMVGTVGWVTKDPRLGLLSLLVLFIAGMLLLRLVEEPVSRH